MAGTNVDVNDLNAINTCEESQTGVQQQLANGLAKKRRCEEMTTDDPANQQIQPDKILKLDLQQEKSTEVDPKMEDKSSPPSIQNLQQKINDLENSRKTLLNQITGLNAEIMKKNKETHRQMDQTSTEVNPIWKELEMQISNNSILEDTLEEQEKSTKLIIQELGQEIAELEEANGLFHTELRNKNIAHTQEINSLCNRIRNLYTNITCSICRSHWTSAGEHRLVSLYCGHLFGKRCIEVLHECPKCGLAFAETDMRIIYARNIQPVD
ncbi:E3 ubiquitin-protein ligase RFWD3-like [Drosophila subobscura]|uniref:E3 ubiquitin-protein ligase RFWD3-like n=1 Tax=Drosophila subobscura TaxID=7241 RepID=UPI00155B23F6|nr:E3 ubiquitin-protein ligase RFWD3-like [Drosophila subobscura]